MPLIRPATSDDSADLASIYAQHVLGGVATFEEVPPTPGMMAQRLAAVQAHALPWLVLEDAGRVQGYAYAAPYKTRSAYRFCVEDSIYLDQACTARGFGTQMLGALITQCEARGIRQMLAIIGGGVEPSVRLHAKLGFEMIGRHAAVGWKFGAWQDIVLMQRALGPGADAPPSAKGGFLQL